MFIEFQAGRGGNPVVTISTRMNIPNPFVADYVFTIGMTLKKLFP